MKDKTCVWCRAPATAERLCHQCYEKALGIPQMSAAALDALPYGAITLDARGTVLSFNRAEEEFSGRDRAEVLGKNFFVDVAPCTKVRVFQSRFRSFLCGTKPVKVFKFEYQFASGPASVHLVFVRVAGEEALVIVRKTTD